MRPLTAMFLDCDSYFASVEQCLDPALRGRPVAVAPVMAEPSCCIAASYEAKRYGVKTGTRISKARVLCPDIVIVQAKPPEYVRIHHRIIELVEDCIHVEDVLSIDEMWCWLPYNLREPRVLERIAGDIKARIAECISPALTISIGVGSNRYLAKLASKMNKPDGLRILQEDELPQALHVFQLSDITGIGRSMEARLYAAGIYTVKDLCRAPKHVLSRVWGSVLGDRLWFLLRGYEIPELVSARKSISHSHVLPPDFRSPERARVILYKLLHKACERLRFHQLTTREMTIDLRFLRQPPWSGSLRFPETDITFTLMRILGKLWRARPDPRAAVLQVRVVLTRLRETTERECDLFAGRLNDYEDEEHAKYRQLDAVVDHLRTRYGRDVLYYGSVHEGRDEAPMRISFTHIPDLKVEE